MKDLAGNFVVADIKIKETPSSDVKSSAVVDHARRQTRRADDSGERHNALLRALSAETERDGHGSQDALSQRIERQEGDIIIILQNLQALQKEMRSFQKEIDSLRTASDDIRAQQDEQQNYVLTEDLEPLTETVSNLSGRLGEVGSLKLEMKMMQSRVKRLEEEKRGPPSIMGPTPTPRSSTNGVRPVQSYDKTQEKSLGSNISSSRPNAYATSVDSALNRARAASVQRDYTQTPKASLLDRARAASVQLDYMRTPAVGSSSSHSRAASVQRDNSHRSHSRSEMPPPEIPNRAASRNAPELRSSSDTARNPRSQNNLHNAISALNESANEFPEVVEDSDEEYDDQDPSPDLENGSHRPRRGRQSLPSRMASVDVDGEYKGNPQKRRRTTSHALNADPSPPPDDPAYRSLWAAPIESERGTPGSAPRNAHGFVLKSNGEIDKRSLRFLGKSKNKRRNVPKFATRDEQGYLLNPDGTRNERSVSIIDGMRRREREESEAAGRS